MPKPITGIKIRANVGVNPSKSILTPRIAGSTTPAKLCIDARRALFLIRCSGDEPSASRVSEIG